MAEIVVKTPTATSLSVSATVDFDQATPLHNLKELDLLPQVSGALSLGESAGTKELRLTVSPEIMQKVNNKILIPNYSRIKGIDSLNVAIATALACAEFRRRI